MVVGIVGVGGLGHIAIQFAAAMGCVVVAVSRHADKKEDAIRFGATDFVISTDLEQMQLHHGRLDVLLNTVSGATSLDAYLSLLRPRGTMVCVGLPAKDVANQTRMYMQSTVVHEKAICGSYLGSHRDYAAMLAFAAAHGVAPVVEIVPFEHTNAAVDKVKHNTARYRMVLQMAA
jgi:uncharacterized zinc-type alcohol dehydrogenase-like protein